MNLSGVISGAGFGLNRSHFGTVNVSGVNTYTGGTTIQTGTLNLTGRITSGTNAASLLSVGTVAGTAVMNINGGTMLANKNTSPSIVVGNVSGAQWGCNYSQFGIDHDHFRNLAGRGARAPYGALILNNGVINDGSYLALGRSFTTATGAVGRGLYIQNGGTLTVAANTMSVGSYQGGATSSELDGVAIFNAGVATVPAFWPVNTKAAISPYGEPPI